ncbi:esterase [Polystyrenella longa]|uniref:Esterase n=1 Tax=Polystyrenella longa TaxID=2528007 RepID=A0A518CQH2_9PLAN|nr:alpha/beta fold hydrolase [Polystyrenella longa]QDU81478.1 esterase [Polystyrenella longa]
MSFSLWKSARSIVSQNEWSVWAIVLILVAVCNPLAWKGTLAAEEEVRLSLPSPEVHQLCLEFLDYDAKIPLDARTVARQEDQKLGTVKEKIVFRGTQGFWCSSYLEIPTQAVGKVPLVLLLHGWSGSKESWWKEGGYLSGGNVRQALLDSGYAVFAMDAQAHGDRIAVNDYAPVNVYAPPEGEARQNYFALSEIYVQTVRDYRRALDYLQQREEIDPDRIGLVGYSMGGTHSFMLMGADERIKASVCCVVPASSNYGVTYIAPENFVPALESRPFLMLMGKTDPLCPEANAIALKNLMTGEHHQLQFFESGHKLPLDYVPHAVDWIKAHLPTE